MAHVPIREYDAKRLYDTTDLSHAYSGVLVTADDLTPLDTLDSSITYAVKPDHLFGKRADYGLVGLDLTPPQLRDRITTKTGDYTIQDKTGHVNTFLIEPMVSIVHEYYLVIQTARTCDTITFSPQGGTGIEERRDSVVTIDIPLQPSSHNTHNTNKQSTTPLTSEALTTLLADAGITDLPQTAIEEIVSLYCFFVQQHFAYLEINPLVIDSDGQARILDMVAKIDDTAHIRHGSEWDIITHVQPWGRSLTPHPVERLIHDLDQKSGASLKCSIINPSGDIWLLLGGGGASVIAMDTFGEVGLLDRVANYGELSGNPDLDNNIAYIDAIVDAMLATDNHQLTLCLIGSIANFTWIDATGKAIATALHNHADRIAQRDFRVYVRRGGLNDTIAYQIIQSACDQLSIPCQLHDTNISITRIIRTIADDIG